MASFSPNGDERYDAASLSGRFSETVDWRVRIRDGDAVLKRADRPRLDLRGHVGRPRRRRGRPRRRVRVRHPRPDAWGNGPTTTTGTLTVDTAGPSSAAVSPGADAARWFSPNGDGSRDTVAWTATTTERGHARRRGSTTPTTSGSTRAPVEQQRREHDRPGTARRRRAVVPDGVYTVRVTPRDAAGTNGPTVERTVRVDTTPRIRASSSTSVFYPQDGDAPGADDDPRLPLTRPMTVTWTDPRRGGHGRRHAPPGRAAPPPGGDLGASTAARPTAPCCPPVATPSLVTATDGTTTRRPVGRRSR